MITQILDYTKQAFREVSSHKKYVDSGPTQNQIDTYRKHLETYGVAGIFDELGGVLQERVMTSAQSFSDLLRSVCPGGKRAIIKRALEFAEGESSIIQDIVGVKKDFFIKGFTLNVEAASKSAKTKIDDFARAHQIKKIVEELLFDYFATDTCILQWRVGAAGMEYVQSLSPEVVDVVHTVQGSFLKYFIPARVRKTVSYLQGLPSNNPEKKNLEVFPKKIIEAIRRGDRFVPLKNSDGEFWSIQTKARRFTGIARPSMYAIFPDIWLTQLLQSGDFAVAYFLKRIIEHVKVGESPPSGAGSMPQSWRQLYPDADDVNSVKEQLSKVGQALRLITNHTVEIEYPSPSADQIKPDKFQKVEERIIRWGGTIAQLLTGEGPGFAQGHLGTRRIMAEADLVRGKIEEMLVNFFNSNEVRREMSLPRRVEVSTSWDNQIFKDPAQILKEISSLTDRGGMDWRTTHDQLGYNHDIIKKRKEEDHDNAELWRPTFEKSQGMMSDEGRPVEGGPQSKNENTPRTKVERP